MKERFIEVSKEIIEYTGESTPIELKDFENIDNNNIDKKIKLDKNVKITLKKFLTDELVFINLQNNGFEPTYNYYKKDDSIIIRVESPGNCNINSKIEYSGEYTIIKLFGEKIKDIEPKKLEENIYNNREFGNFFLDVPLKTEDYLVKNEEPKIIEKKGVLILEFKLDEKKDNKGFQYEDEI